MSEPTIIDMPLPDGLLGATDGVSTIWLDDQLLAADRRVVLEHELIHLENGDRASCVTLIEHGIDREVACRLITVDDLGEAAAWSEHVVVIADELDVMPETVEHRLHALTPGERAALEARVENAHWAF